MVKLCMLHRWGITHPQQALLFCCLEYLMEWLIVDLSFWIGWVHSEKVKSFRNSNGGSKILVLYQIHHPWQISTHCEIRSWTDMFCYIEVLCQRKESFMIITLNPKPNIWVLLTIVPLCERSHTHFNLVDFLWF